MMDPDEGCLEGGYVARACVHFDNFLISSGLQVHQNATKWRTDCFWHRASASTATTPPVSLIVLIPACSRSPLELERYRNFVLIVTDRSGPVGVSSLIARSHSFRSSTSRSSGSSILDHRNVRLVRPFHVVGIATRRRDQIAFAGVVVYGSHDGGQGGTGRGGTGRMRRAESRHGMVSRDTNARGTVRSIYTFTVPRVNIHSFSVFLLLQLLPEEAEQNVTTLNIGRGDPREGRRMDCVHRKRSVGIIVGEWFRFNAHKRPLYVSLFVLLLL